MFMFQECLINMITFYSPVIQKKQLSGILLLKAACQALWKISGKWLFRKTAESLS